MSLTIAHIIPILFAMSRASCSEERHAYAFLSPLGVIRVLTFLILILYICYNCSLMVRLLAFLLTMKTRVLVSSIDLMTDSVLSGYLTVLKRSVLVLFTECLITFDSLFCLRVLGLLKVVFFQIFDLLAW